MPEPPENTYSTTPWVYAQIGKIGDATDCSTAGQFPYKIQNTLIEAGWTGALTPHILEVHISKTFGFTLCTLGYSNFNFYTVTVGSFVVVVMDNESTEEGQCCEGIKKKDGPCYDHMVANGVDLFLFYPYNNALQKFKRIREAISIAYADNFWHIKWMNEVETDDEYVIYGLMYFISPSFEEPIPDPCPPELFIGNQLATSYVKPVGYGTICKTQNSILEENNATIYLRIQPDSSFPLQRMVFYYKLGNFDTFAVNEVGLVIVEDGWVSVTGEDYSDFELPIIDGDSHPYFQVIEDAALAAEDKEISILPLNDTTIDYEMWANPYGFFLNPMNTPGGDDVSVCLLVVKPKPLFGESRNETDNWKIRRAVWFQGGLTNWITANYITNGSDAAIELTIKGETPIRKLVSSGGGDHWGPCIFNVYGVRSGINIGDLSWISGEAEIAEPWVGCNFFDTDDGVAPIIGQIWDMIFPSRNLDIGFGSARALFTWDKRLWRYVQVNKSVISDTSETVGSMAVCVEHGGVFSGVPFSTEQEDVENAYAGPILADITFVQISPNPVFAGSSVDFTFTINHTNSNYIEDGRVARAEGLMIYFWLENTNRVIVSPQDQVVIFAQDDLLIKTLTFSTVNLEIEEDAILVAKGANGTVRAEFTFSDVS